MGVTTLGPVGQSPHRFNMDRTSPRRMCRSSLGMRLVADRSISRPIHTYVESCFSNVITLQNVVFVMFHMYFDDIVQEALMCMCILSPLCYDYSSYTPGKLYHTRGGY